MRGPTLYRLWHMVAVLSAFLVRVRIWTNRLSSGLGFGDDGFLVVLAILIGIVTAAAAVSFHELIDLIRHTVYARIPQEKLYGNWVWLLLIFPTAGGLIVGLANLALNRKGKPASHGVVDVMETVTRASGWLRPMAALETIFLSAVTIGTGGSAGAEGPIVQIGAAVSSGFGRAFGMARPYVPVLIGCGTAAGISSIFNSPIGGVIFTLEVILYDFSIRAFLPIVLASVIANVTTDAIFHKLDTGTYHSIFYVSPSVGNIEALNWPSLPNFVILGLVCGGVGVTLTRLMYCSEELFRQVRIAKPLRPALGGLLLGVLGVSYVLIFGWLMLDRLKPFEGYAMPAFFGDGYGVIQQLFDEKFYAGWDIGKLALLLGLLVVAKIIGTCLTLSSGGSGGIIAPSLFLGATTGALLGLGLHEAGIAAHVPVTFYALVGMGAVLAAVVHAPLAAILILFEVTQQRGVVLPAMLASVVATGTARLIFPDSIYTLSLRRRGVKVGASSDLRILRRITVDQVELDPVSSVTIDTSFEQVVKQTSESGAHDFVVFDKQGVYAGMVTAEDVRTALLQPESIPLLLAGEVMRVDIPCVRSNEDLASVLETFSRFEVARIPVCVSSNPGHVIGLISRGSLMRRYHQALAES
jgi:CIC family chloride channel protein